MSARLHRRAERPKTENVKGVPVTHANCPVSDWPYRQEGELELMGIKQLQLVLIGAVYCKETGR
jgi:hypothetical protein